MTTGSRVAVLSWLALLAGSMWFVGSKTQVVTDLSFLLPQTTTPTERLFVNELREGPTSRLILVGLEGGDADVLAATSKALARSMRASRDFVYASNGQRLWSKEERELLFQHRYLLSPAIDAERFNTEGLRDALKSRLRELASPVSPLVKRSLPADPTGEF